MTDGIKLIVGLGNPGPQYKNTRHNVGFWFVHSLAESYDGDLRLEPKFRGFLTSVVISDHKCLLLLPETFMNLSGESVAKVVNFYKISISSILVVHDELDFAPGTIRIKQGGGANGHNGVQSIIDRLGDKNFWRMRIGIGKPKLKDDMSGYVLSSPSRSELKEIGNAIDQAVDLVPKLITGDFQNVLSELHSVEKH